MPSGEETETERETHTRRKSENNPRWPRRWTTNKRSNTWYSKVDSLVFLAEVSLKAFQCVSFSVYFLVFILFIAILCSGCCHIAFLPFSSSLSFSFAHTHTHTRTHHTIEIQRQIRKKKKIRTKGDNRANSDGGTIGNSGEDHELCIPTLLQMRMIKYNKNRDKNMEFIFIHIYTNTYMCARKRTHSIKMNTMNEWNKAHRFSKQWQR